MTYYGAAELARSFRVVRKNLLTIAEEIPEDKYDFRPVPGSRSVREILAHIAVLSKGSYHGHAVKKITTFVGMDFQALVKSRLEEQERLSTASKSDVIDLLRKDGEAWGAYLDSVPEADLAHIISFEPPAEPLAKSRFEMLLGVKEHEMHHRAQLMVYQRLLGLVPHLTRIRQARFASPPQK